jgi:hypothetical protein
LVTLGWKPAFGPILGLLELSVSASVTGTLGRPTFPPPVGPPTSRDVRLHHIDAMATHLARIIPHLGPRTRWQDIAIIPGTEQRHHCLSCPYQDVDFRGIQNAILAGQNVGMDIPMQFDTVRMGDSLGTTDHFNYFCE